MARKWEDKKIFKTCEVGFAKVAKAISTGARGNWEVCIISLVLKVSN